MGIGSLVIFGISSVLGMAFFGPRDKRMQAMFAADGSQRAEVERELGRYMLVARIDLLLILAAVVIMALKPFD